MKEYLIETLSALGYPVILEGSLAPKSYPESFISFWNFSSYNRSFDDEDKLTEYGYNVRFYSTSPAVVEKAKKDILKTLKSAGFIPDGCGNDFTFNSETAHLGWSVDVYILEDNENG